MESVDLLNTEQGSPSVDRNTGHDHNSFGLKLSNNSHRPSSNLNSSSAFSRKSKPNPAIIPTEFGLSVSFFQDSERNSDSEALKNCETRWLQLFRLVEKKCQEQIAAQQKVFCHQIHRIRNEIKHLVKLQNQNVCLCNKQVSEVQLTNSFSSLESQMGLQCESFEENELFAIQLKTSDVQSRPEASAVHPECFPNSVSISSGYATCSAAELNFNSHKDVQMCMENTDEIIKSKDSGSSAEEDLVTASVHNKKEFTPPVVEYSLPLKDDNIVFPSEFEPTISEGQCGKTSSSKPLTSWAQKLKQNQLKRTNGEEESVRPLQCKEETQTLPPENTNPTAAIPPPYTFYLNQPNGSQNSLASDTSGLTYWKLDEKEMYHSLPENFGNEFSLLSAKMSSEQLSSVDEVKPSFLKDIYHQKQKEGKQLTGWDFSPSQSTHPPEILTLDPTLHMKPGQQDPGLPPRYFCGTPGQAPFSPDSVADPAFFIQSDTDSFSHMSTVPSPQSVGSPKYASDTTALHTDPWNSCTLPNETSANRSSHLSSEIFNTENEGNLTLTPSSAAHSQLLPADNSSSEFNISVTCLEDPVVFSKIRQNLKEKHARHIADLRAYYDSEIQSLKQQLEASHKPPLEDLRKINQNLSSRCDQLEAVLNEANSRMRALEDKNNALEMEVTDWKERFCAVSNTTKALQERIEEMRTSSKEKDNTISRLKRRLKDLEEAFEKAYKLSDNKDARLKEENKMFHNLLGEYESLGKEHERVKDTLNITENKLLDAHTQVSDLKRTVSKLEAQIKQLEHENLLRFRHFASSHFRTSNANASAGSDVSRRKWLIPGSEYSIFTGQPLDIQEPAKDNRLEETYAPSRSDPRYNTPPEKDACPEPLLTNETSKNESDIPETPIIKAFKELEGRKAMKNWGPRTEKEEAAAPSKTSARRPAVGFDETALSTSRSPEKSKDQARPKKYNSPNGQRSSSVPPSNRKSSTPTTREIMLTPIAVTYSPKRSPKENLSPGFSHLLSRNENTMTRFDILLDDLERSPASASQLRTPRKRLQFLSVGDPEEPHQPSPSKDSCGKAPFSTVTVQSGGTKGLMGPAWAPESSAHASEPHLSSAIPAPLEADFQYISRIKTLAETERLFDELTHEKQQIEARLSRIPCAGGRMTLQARLNQEALEDRLERINRELGHIRMILKRFHVLRTSANI